METKSKKFMPQVNIRDFVILPILDVDRGLTDPPNLVCRIVNIDLNTNLCYEYSFCSNCFDLVEPSAILKLNFKLDTTI